MVRIHDLDGFTILRSMDGQIPIYWAERVRHDQLNTFLRPWTFRPFSHCRHTEAEVDETRQYVPLFLLFRHLIPGIETPSNTPLRSTSNPAIKPSAREPKRRGN